MISKERPECPYCLLRPAPDGRFKIVRKGSYKRADDHVVIHKFHCRGCGAYFSEAVFDNCYRQKKRSHNRAVLKSFVSLESQRRIALTEPLNRKTVVRKLLFFARFFEDRMVQHNSQRSPAKVIEFDDLETSLHTKLKPISVTLVVETKSRHILGFEVSQMPAKGKLAELSRKKYGHRPDKRAQGRKLLFERIKPWVHPQAIIKSDQNPSYPASVKRHFPQCTHSTVKGRRARINGQGEIKTGGWDPLFSLNHTCAMLRANINRLIRKTWCTSKRADRLRDHILLYACFHNELLINR